ncbi:MAG: methylamine utilization protein [Gammaproteobacteria bacterium]|nr:methylamine utilization protein [Gammaproteobacteria bacterium]
MSKHYSSKALLLLAGVCLGGTAIAAEHTVQQQNKTFVQNGAAIEKISVKVGDVINFKNEDPFFHNIFSLSPLKTFDLGSYPAGQSKSVTFDKAGMAEVECAIHPQMFLEVEVK